MRNKWLFFILFYIPFLAGSQEYDGLQVDGRFLYDQCGEKVILRGMNAFIVYWDRDGSVHYPQIAKTGANCVRIFWQTGHDPEPFMPPADLDKTIQNCLKNKMIPMPCLWDATGEPLGGEMWQKCLDYWTHPEVMAVLKKHQKFLILNIANEVGQNNVTNQLFREEYKKAIDTLRNSGLHVPLVIDASNWGRAERYILDNAKYLIHADPDRNLLFSWHPWDNNTSTTRVDQFFEQAKRDTIPIIVGEFSNTDVFGKAFAYPDIWRHIIERCHEYQNGYLPWWWSARDNEAIHQVTQDRLFGNWVNAPWGEEVVIGSEYSILNTSVRPKPLLGQACFSSVNETDSTQDVLIYPNPAKDAITIYIPPMERAVIQLFDAWGQLIGKRTGVSTVQMDIGEELSGIYILRVSFKGKQYHYKIIKQ
ncbi:MAG: T9SS type A sorting domain-containing protein [Mariniphaga sp.]|nr:T9SS type A sorting domain-containing protein [Mariniphaga sp.]